MKKKLLAKPVDHLPLYRRSVHMQLDYLVSRPSNWLCETSETTKTWTIWKITHWSDKNFYKTMKSAISSYQQIEFENMVPYDKKRSWVKPRNSKIVNSSPSFVLKKFCKALFPTLFF